MAGMICLFQGRRGCGKTLSMTWWSSFFSSLDWDVFSNYNVKNVQKITEEFILNLDKDSDLRDCVLLVDEMQIFFDSRLWKEATKFSHFLQQIRKRNIVILGTTQYIDTIEKRIRQHVDFLIKPFFDSFSGVCTDFVYDLTSFEDSSEPDYFEISFHLSEVADLYDTNEML